MKAARRVFGHLLPVVVFGWVAVGCTLLSGWSWLRTPVVFGFAMIGPGLAIVGLLRQRSVLEYLVLAVAFSVSLTTLVAEALAVARFWHPSLAIAILAAVTTVAARLCEVMRVRRTGETVAPSATTAEAMEQRA